MPRRLTGGCGLKCLLTYAEESIFKCLLIADDSHEISRLVFLRNQESSYKICHLLWS